MSASRSVMVWQCEAGRSVMVWQCEAGSDECKQVGGCVGVGVGMVEWECMCGVGIVGCGVYTYN
jgi:hypothetical protein